jgi:hypothetical protein
VPPICAVVNSVLRLSPDNLRPAVERPFIASAACKHEELSCTARRPLLHYTRTCDRRALGALAVPREQPFIAESAANLVAQLSASIANTPELKGLLLDQVGLCGRPRRSHRSHRTMHPR